MSEGARLLASGQAAAAVEVLQQAVAANPAPEAVWYNLGMAAYRNEDWQTAAEAFAEAAERNPHRAANFLFGGLALERLERYQEAVHALERSLELDPARYQAHYHLWVCYERLGDTERSRRHRERYEATRPQ